MGSHYRVHVGPYIRCNVQTSALTKKVNTCSNEECRLRRQAGSVGEDNKFCPKCGAPAEVITAEVEGQLRSDVDSYDVVEGTNERLYQWNGNYSEDGAHLFLPNNTKARGKTYGDDEDCSSGELVTDVPAQIDDDVAWLANAYAEEIALCKGLYGDENVNVCWGVLGGWG